MERIGNLGFPFTAAIVGGQTAAGFLFGREGPRQKRTATGFANEAKRQLQANLEAFEAGQISQAQAAANAEGIWQTLAFNCSQLGEPGQRCISERQPGGRFDWFEKYIDPILEAAPAASEVIDIQPSSAVSEVLPAELQPVAGLSSSGLMFAVAAIAIGAVVMR